MKAWFERDFSRRIEPAEFKALYRRLEEAPLMYRHGLTSLPLTEDILGFNAEGKWSVKENLGHLILLEPLWLTRFGDILEGKAVMSPADLSNSGTDSAGFNKVPLDELLDGFAFERQRSLDFLRNVREEGLRKESLHPRLQVSMTVPDLMYFVAEHDDHHWERILYIADNFAAGGI